MTFLIIKQLYVVRFIVNWFVMRMLVSQSTIQRFVMIMVLDMAIKSEFICVTSLLGNY